MGNNANAKLTKPSVSLSRTERKLIQSSWSSHVRKDEFIGAKVFDRLFTESPEAKDSFSNFANIDVNDDYYNEVLHRHGSRVKNAVGKVIDSLDYPYEYKKFLIRMGARHYKEYNFDPQYSQVILEYFLADIKDTMGEDWSSEIEVAYRKLFSIMTFYMIDLRLDS